MSTICIPAEIARELPIDAVRAAFASLGLVLDARYGSDRTLTARWASEAAMPQVCREPGCARLPSILLDGAPYCVLHYRQRREDRAIREASNEE